MPQSRRLAFLLLSLLTVRVPSVMDGPGRRVTRAKRGLIAYGSAQAGETVEHQTAGDGDIEAGPFADHRDLHADVGALDPPGRDALVLVAEEDNRRLARRSQSR